MKKLPKILDFIVGSVATELEQGEIDSISANVSLRNASMINPEWTPEVCDGVAGMVPESYAHMPNPDQALTKMKEITDSVLNVISEVLPQVVVETQKKLSPQLQPKAKPGAAASTAKVKPVWNPNKG